MAGFQTVLGRGEGSSWIHYEPNAYLRPETPWRRRLRYWLSSFRGYAAFDVRGTGPR